MTEIPAVRKNGCRDRAAAARHFLLALPIAMLGMCFLAFLFYAARLPRLKTLQGRGTTYAAVAADGELALLAAVLPESATDVDFYYKPRMQWIQIDFTITEAAFLQWADAKGWPMKQITAGDGPVLLPIPSGEPSHLIGVRDGYGFTERRYRGNDTGSRVGVITYSLDVVFDSATGRAHFRFSGGAMKEPWARANR